MTPVQLVHLEEIPYSPDSPVLFERLRELPYSVFLDSAHPYSLRGRFDIMAADPIEHFAFDPTNTGNDSTIFDWLKSIDKAYSAISGDLITPSEDIPFCGGLIGYLSYDSGRALERLEPLNPCAQSLSTSMVGLYDWCVVQDHLLQRALFIALPSCSEQRRDSVLNILNNPLPPAHHEEFVLETPFAANISEEQYHQQLNTIQHYILSGDCYQVNFAQRFTSNYRGDPWQAYRHLRGATSARYSAYLQLEENALLSLSPEQFLRLRGNHVETRPIKGTRPRGENPSSDEMLARELRASTKDRAENLMIVDLLRNDLGKVCTPGSIHVDELFGLEQLPNVHHMVSTISGELRDECSALDLLAHCAPGGSITGAPKHRAMQIIDELEGVPRGAYCGSIFYLSADGSMDSNIMIRTLQCTAGTISCWGGGGIVADSDWRLEYRETFDKVGGMLSVLQERFGASGQA